MVEASDGIAEELERQLQLALAAAAILARRAVAAREQSIEQATRDSQRAARTVTARLKTERQLAAAQLQPVFDTDWWETARPQDVAGMWQRANSGRDAGQDAGMPTIFDRAAGRIGQELRDRAGLDPPQLVALAAVQDLEHEHQARLPQPAGEPGELQDSDPEVTHPHSLDDRQHREQLRARLEAAGVSAPAIEARTLADIAQARDAAEAVQTPVAAAAAPRAATAGAPRRQRRRDP